MALEQVDIPINVSGNAEQTIGELRKEVEALLEEITRFKEGSEEAEEAAKRYRVKDKELREAAGVAYNEEAEAIQNVKEEKKKEADETLRQEQSRAKEIESIAGLVGALSDLAAMRSTVKEGSEEYEEITAVIAATERELSQAVLAANSSILGQREQNIALLIRHEEELHKTRLAYQELKEEVISNREALLSVNRDTERGQKLYEERVETLFKLEDGLAALRGKEIELKTAISDLQSTLKTGQKEMNASGDSAEQLAKRLESLRIAYRKMNDGEKESPVGRATLQSIQALDGYIKGFDVSIGNHQRSVGNYAIAISALNRALPGTQKGITALSGVLRLQDQLFLLSGKNIGLATKALSFFEKANEATAKALKISAGAAKLLNAALGSGLLLLLQEGVKLAKIFIDNLADKRANEAKKEREAYTRAAKLANKEMERSIALMEAEGASEADLIQARRAGTRDLIKTTEAKIDAIYLEIKALQERWKWWFSGDRKLLKERQAQLLEYQKDYEKLLDDLDNLNNDYTKAEARQRRQSSKNAEKRLKEIEREGQKIDELRGKLAELSGVEDELYRSSAGKELSIFDQIQGKYDEMLAVSVEMQAVEQKRGEGLIDEEAYLSNMVVLQGKRNGIVKDTVALEQKQKKLEEELAGLQGKVPKGGMSGSVEFEASFSNDPLVEELSHLQDQVNSLLLEKQALDDALKDPSSTEEAIANTKRLIETERNLSEAKRAATKTRMQLDAQEQQNRKAMLSSTADILGASASLFAENTIAYKALASAQAVISTWQAASAALAMVPHGPWNYVSMAAAITTGLANVKKIWEVDVPGGNGGSSSVPTPSLPSMPRMSTSITETHNNMTAREEDLYNKDTRVYVLESDISSAQARVSVSETESKF